MAKTPKDVDLTSNTRNDVTADEGGLLDNVHGATNPTLRGETYPQAVRSEVGDFEGRTIAQPRPWEKYQNDMSAASDKAAAEYRKATFGSDDVETDVAQDSQDDSNAGNKGLGSNSATPKLGEEKLDDSGNGGAHKQHVEDARKEG